jgi:hypothetical protein
MPTETSGSAAAAAAAAGEVGWYVLGPNQESVGPYALAELRGDHTPPPPCDSVHLNFRVFSLRLCLGFSP